MDSSDTRQYCLDNKIPSMSVILTWDTNKNKKHISGQPTRWNDITVDTYKSYINSTLNGFAILCGRRNGSNKRFVVIDTDDTKAELKGKPIDSSFKEMLKGCCQTIEKTPGGEHYYFLLNEDQDDLTSGDTKVNGKKIEYVDLLSNGKMVLCAPSCYKNGKGDNVKYVFVKGSLETVGFMPNNLYRMLTAKVVESDVETDPQEDNQEKKIDFIRECLECLSVDISTDYQTWIRIGLLLKLFFNDNDSKGLELFDMFSKKSPNYDVRGVVDFWRQARPNGSIRGGTLLYFIKQDDIKYKTNNYERLHTKMCKVFHIESFAVNKEVFEENHFYCEETEDICKIQEDGSLTHSSTTKACYTFAEFNYMTGDKQNIFANEWLNCKTKRIIRKVVNTPDINSVKDDEYNLFKGMKGSMAQGENLEGLERFKYLIKLNANYNEENEKYITQWYAKLLQNPIDIPRVCMIFIGEEGCGKDTVCDFIGKSIIGQKYFANISDAKNELYDTHSTAMVGSFFQKLEEASATDNKTSANKLKALITKTDVIVNEKNVKKFSMNAYPHFVMTTNETSPVALSDTDRRFFIVNVSSDMLGNVNFWNETYKLLQDEGTIASVYNYLINYDLSTFVSTNFPVTNMKKALQNSQACPVKVFLLQWIPEVRKDKNNKDTLWYSSTDLYKEYKIWSQEEEKELYSHRKFGIQCVIHKERGIVKGKFVDCKNWYSKDLPSGGQ